MIKTFPLKTNRNTKYKAKNYQEASESLCIHFEPKICEKETQRDETTFQPEIDWPDKNLILD